MFVELIIYILKSAFFAFLLIILILKSSISKCN